MLDTEFTHRIPIEYTDVLFYHVIAHHFEGMQSGNILFAIEPDTVEQIFEEYHDMFVQFHGEGWPLHYTTSNDLFVQLQARQIRAFRIVPSYGGTGWIWAERMEKHARPSRRMLEP